MDTGREDIQTQTLRALSLSLDLSLEHSFGRILSHEETKHNVKQ